MTPEAAATDTWPQDSNADQLCSSPEPSHFIFGKRERKVGALQPKFQLMFFGEATPPIQHREQRHFWGSDM